LSSQASRHGSVLGARRFERSLSTVQGAAVGGGNEEAFADQPQQFRDQYLAFVFLSISNIHWVQ
jgi:hypothetical protein